MLNSIFKKLFTAIISLALISLLLFFLSKAVPGDPVEMALGISSDSEISLDYDVEYERKKRNLNLDLPLFYFSFIPENFPTTSTTKGSLSALYASQKDFLAKNAWSFPRFHWHGDQNQYHKWLFARNTSLKDGKPVAFKIRRSLVWTLFLVIVSVVFSYGIGILIGVALSTMKKMRLQSLLEASLFGIYAIPVFWMATLLLVFFTTKEYGAWTNIFPSVGLAPIDYGEAWYLRIGKFGAQLVLPCFVLVLHNLAFLSMLTKRNIDRNKRLPFVMTSRAYGFSEREILWKEVLPMSLLPLITSISSTIPSAIGGSLIIEIIFNIPGMGRLLYDAILSYDWPLVFPIVLLIAVITFVSFLLADIFYKIADPRIA